MEITVLGEYMPFGQVEEMDKSRASPSHTPPFLSPEGFRFGELSDENSFLTTTPAGFSMPRYELYPPTQDGIVNDNPEPKADPDDFSKNRSKSARGYDVEVVVRGSKVTWTQGGILRKILDFGSENEIIQQTLFAWFTVNNPSQKTSDRELGRERERDEEYDIEQLHSAENPGADRQGRQQALVIILKDTARIYFPSGESHSVFLPFRVHRAWAMDLGLLLERKPEPNEEVSEEMMGVALPRFYMIMDPFNEVQVVTLYRLPMPAVQSKSATQEDIPRQRYENWIVGDIFNTCVFLSHLDALDRTLVTYDLLWKRHRVWCYKSSRPSSLPFSKMKRQEGVDASSAMDVDNDANDPDHADDLKMRTDTYMCEIDSNLLGASCDSAIFSAHDFDGRTVICVLDREAERLACYRVIGDQRVEHLWTRPAQSAIGVEATRKQQRDILILSSKGVLQLWTGAGDPILCHINVDIDFLRYERGVKQFPKHRNSNIHSREPTSKSIKSWETDASIEDAIHIIEIRDAVENRVSIVLSDGTILRARTDFLVRSSLVQDSMDAISYALPVEVLWDFRHRFLQLQFDKDTKACDADEWDNFATTLLSYCNPSFTPPVMSSPKMQTRSLHGLLPKKPAIADSDWDFFLDSDMHRMLNSHPSFRSEPLTLPVSTSSPYTEMILEAQKLATLHFRGPATRGSLRLDEFYNFILVALHLVYEDRNINLTTSKEGNMAPLLMLMSHIVGWKTWVDAYARRDFTNIKRAALPEVYMEGTKIPLVMYQYEPPDIFRWISDVVSHPQETKSFPTLMSLAKLRDPDQSEFVALSSAPCDQLRQVTLFFKLLMTGEESDQSAVRAIVGEAFTKTQLDQLPFGVSIPLREALWKCQRSPPLDLNSDALSFIGRNDLAELASKKPPGYYMKPPSHENIEPSKRQDIHTLCEDMVHQDVDGEPEVTGTELTESDITDLRFGADMRVAEAQKMLRSSVMPKVKPEDAPDLSEEDLRAAHQALLVKMAFRTLALPVGRGIFTFGTATPILNQKCPIPLINLSAKVLPSYGVVEPELSALGGEQVFVWPSFHNGVAAGLRISPNSKDVNSSWIIYNRPEVLNGSHAGFLLALGLTGHLRALLKSHVWRYLSFKHEMTSTGLLLGLACAHRGTMNTAITRVLSVHMPALLPQHGSELNLSPLTQVACVLGIGLIYMETSHRRMAEVMLSEIGSASGYSTDSVNTLQECHSVAAGFGLGFITLGQGNRAMGLKDMRIVDVLMSYMPGSTDKDRAIKGLAGSDHSEDHGWERRRAGIDMTSAGATVAMGLMYLKTNSKSIAAKLDVPETQYLLDFVTPDALMLRVICKSIVLWGEITPTRSWILSQIPDYLKNSASGPPATETGPQSYYSILAGACFAMGLRFAGSGNETAYECIINHLDMFMELGRGSGIGSYEDSITKSTLRTCLDVTTLSVAMVVAGSGRIDFLRRLRKLVRRRKNEGAYGSHLAYHMALGLLFLGGGGYTLGTSNRCVAALLCSLYPRLPRDPTDNRSHLQAFRHLWVLAVEPRCLVTRDAITGSCCPVPVRVHLKNAYHQAQIQMGLDRKSSVDYHPEILRASQQRQDTRYTGLNANVSQDVATTLFSSSKLDMMTPCLLPELSTISKIEILGPRYWPITIDLSSENEDYIRIWRVLKTRSISVMRHIGHLSYTEDALGMRGILARPFPKVLTSEAPDERVGNRGARRRKQESLQRLDYIRYRTHPGRCRSGFSTLERQYDISSSEGLNRGSASYGEDFGLTFLQDPQVASFASHLCTVRPSVRDSGPEAVKDEARAAYFTNVLYECLTMDKVEVLGVHVWLYDIANRLEGLDELSWRTLWELRILVKYYDTQLKRRLDARVAEVEKGLNEDLIGRGGRKLKSRQAEPEVTLSLALAAQMAGDDGSETLIKVSRLTELVSKITNRMEQAMEDGREVLDEPEWSVHRVAQHYFANGSIPVDRNNGSWARSQTDWFKVWLEVNEVPGPDAIKAIRNALENTRDIWETFASPQGGSGGSKSGGQGKENDGGGGNRTAAAQRTRAARAMLLKQVFTLAYPAVSLKVLDYLIGPEQVLCL